MKLVASELYPAVRRFLLESGLNRTLKALDKETSALEDLPVVKPKKAKALAELELLAACQTWLDASQGVAQSTGVEEAPAETTEAAKPNKKRKRGEAEEAAAQEEAKAAETKEQEAEAEPPQKKAKKQKKEEKQQEKTSGTPFKRIDDEKWKATIKDARLLDNTHTSKAKFGGSEGDSWADSAAGDLLKVKGKGFRKEMQKKKRASWKGGGQLDQGVNSIKFDDSDDE